MKNGNWSKNKKGFTLIEILVVVLIIGILAAISVVQYQKSVLKSRFTALMPITKALYEGEELFAMSSGKYTDKLENLDISTTGGVSGSTANINGSIVTLGVNNRHTYVKATRENFDNNLIMFQKGSRYFPGEIHCEAKEGKTLANWLCEKELSGEKLDRSLTEGYTDYVINGDGNGVFPKDWVNVSGTSAAKKLELSSGDTCTGTEGEWQCAYLTVNNGACYGKVVGACARSNYINSYCEGTKAISTCAGSAFANSYCVGAYPGACNNGTFTNSTCEGDGGYTCGNSTYNDSVCIGSSLQCYSSTFNGDSSCIGNHKNACIGSTFKDNSICYAKEEGACGTYEDSTTIKESVYQGKACCKGTYCPASAPKCDCGIDPSTGQHALSC